MAVKGRLELGSWEKDGKTHAWKHSNVLSKLSHLLKGSHFWWHPGNLHLESSGFKILIDFNHDFSFSARPWKGIYEKNSKKSSEKKVKKWGIFVKKWRIFPYAVNFAFLNRNWLLLLHSWCRHFAEIQGHKITLDCDLNPWMCPGKLLWNSDPVSGAATLWWGAYHTWITKGKRSRKKVLISKSNSVLLGYCIDKHFRFSKIFQLSTIYIPGL